MFSESDLQQLQQKGIAPSELEMQLEYFRKGFPFIELDRPATAGDGVFSPDKSEAERFSVFYEQTSRSYEVMKFVPASGAATRMFKDLFSLRESIEKGLSIDEILMTQKEGRKFVEGLRDFAFFNRLAVAMSKEGLDIEQCISEKNYLPIVDFLLNEDGLGYASLPKGLLDFHAYETGSRTPVEEHLVEGAVYARSRDGVVRIHFTVSPEHRERFEQKVAVTAPIIENLFGVRFQITFSEQKPSTDTLAVTPDNEPFREQDGKLLFRPGGHGALIENLNDLQAQVLFVKNIDNVVPDRLKSHTFLHKKVLGGILIDYMVKLKNWLERMEQQVLNGTELGQAKDFAVRKLNADSRLFETLEGEQLQQALFEFFNRPVRVCGMVKNEGEPGGGPFWVKGADGILSLQIVESSQIAMNQSLQQNIVKRSTHFNPVDLVCGVVDYKGKKFDLKKFVDPNTGFISLKSKDGKDLKALELPGLWNGAMAHWITIFVEVPLITFNPVKTVNDLLRKEHQPE